MSEKVAVIFDETSKVFTMLSDMCLELGDSQLGGKWNAEEIEMLRVCVQRFSNKLNKLGEHIKNRAASEAQARFQEASGITLQEAYEQAGPSYLQDEPSLKVTLKVKPIEDESEGTSEVEVMEFEEIDTEHTPLISTDDFAEFVNNPDYQPYNFDQ